MINILWTRAGIGSRILVYALLIAASVFTLVPFLWAAVNSVKTLTETFEFGAFIPFLQFQPTLDSWREVLSDPQTTNAFISSCVVSAGTTVFSLILGVPAAYALARYEFPIKSNDIALWFLSQRVLPPAVVLVPFYLLLVYLHLIDTWTGLILCYSAFNLAFVVVIMRDIFRDVSTEIEDAAKVEGATPWQIFWLIALPLSLDGLVVSSVLVFAFSWNEALVRFGVDLAGGRPMVCSHSRFPLHARCRFQPGLGQHADRHHPAGDLLLLRATLPGARTDVRCCERLATLGFLRDPRATSASGVRREKVALSSGCNKSHPANAPAGSNRSSHGSRRPPSLARSSPTRVTDEVSDQ